MRFGRRELLSLLDFRRKYHAVRQLTTEGKKDVERKRLRKEGVGREMQSLVWRESRRRLLNPIERGSQSQC